MNLIVIMLDSLRMDTLGCYGNKYIRTPNIDDFSNDCIKFTNAYPEGLPTLPVRTELFTGKCTLPSRTWQPLLKEDVTVSEILGYYKYTSMLIASTWHYFKPNMNYHRGFSGYRWIRGKEGDNYRTAPSSKNIDDYIKEDVDFGIYGELLSQYLKNIEGREKEEDYFTARVMIEACNWLEKNYRNDSFFLWVDSFDPHEPWDPPEDFIKSYTDEKYSGKKLILPKYGKTDWLTKKELNYIKGLYAASVNFVDKWVGVLLEKIYELNILDNTLIMILADHGHPHGEHEMLMKTPDVLYNELLRIPLLARHPDKKLHSLVIEELIQTHDILPSILDFLGIENETATMNGKSILPVINNKEKSIRDYIVTGYNESEHRCIRTKEWSFILRPNPENNELYNLISDTEERENVIRKYPRIAKDLEKKVCSYMYTPPYMAFEGVQQKFEGDNSPLWERIRLRKAWEKRRGSE